MEFKDTVAIVTGGTRGIGKSIALELAKNGCNIAFNYNKNTDAAHLLVKEIESMGAKAISFQVNAASFEGAKNMVKEVKDRFGKIDFLVNNAGITRDKLLALMAENDWDDVINTNLKSVYNFSKSVITQMIKQKSGSILNITSVSGITGIAGQVNYSSSKAGMIGFTKALAKEVGKANITVNAIACGFIETDMTAVLPQEYKDKMIEMIPVRRFGTPDDVAKAAIFLLSDHAKYITGHVISVDGGLAM
ncbi:MAG: 3-oxoacyl-[acyl-carrier-protein] reductase [Candidatus Jettenia sp.]|uniref:3-oxoacyl-[acyl-carrier-protein] reductase n=1 Tax=Candidatus Jettenia caeni TaxID=247490 RepID=I3IN91_9BACT|nr:3-oxoacyl-[acyl-carrier-protein] reductase [Candidatus Jettenia sp. AMX1]MBC6928067.1 3-oxoacyl-[acyl-carrier-protein] reductase [Candidatus Jettenia sp.]NUN22527.1 3-oxoacyl-[acyl-carrier-protein] reductase [Candidatus Jettenia caeni]KAA0251168.1 MAG: 3-oxoacyl-[acyl-carrier-protein] reductase [Candidatus Jettenia sp. AMX1]MCE7879292.1 3-oxoacyl-[acyl-carrier-protein] reductase [Candidatus Jettenia sp. AMX1]MCQ3927483.1 3-oxoacyl-[acyl-carrier-protein] reductase [Candidatus Jettenia sp.]